jgi:O-antigen/teichoic acid export membrane protein
MTASTEIRQDAPPAGRWLTSAARYGLAAAGPIGISAAHFLASLIYLHTLSRAEFGMFSFLLVVVPFFLSLSSAMIGASVSRAASRSRHMSAAELAMYFKANLAFAALAGATVFGLLLLSHADLRIASLLGIYGGLMTLRWFARVFFYAKASAVPVVVSDFLYSALLLAGLIGLALFHQVTALRAAEVLLLAVSVAFVSFGRTYLRDQLRSLWDGVLADYKTVWLDLARWSALGVFLTELTANAHAYLVTFISGPAAFAPLALGALLMRPVQLVLSALPDRERPVMGRLLAHNDWAGACRSVNEFRMAAGAVWFATLVLAAVLLICFPGLILKKGYDETQALVVLAFFAAIMASRTLRTPESVLMQAAGEFRALAGASFWASCASLAITLFLLLVFGPVASLGGILVGDLVMTSRTISLSRRWVARHA